MTTDRTDEFDVLDAFADGEPVSAGALDAALSDVHGRAYLLDLLALRGLIDRAAVEPPPQVARRPEQRRTAGPMPVAAAVVLVACLGAGIGIGWRLAAMARLPDTPTPADARPVVLPAVEIAAPVPTQIIRFEPGVDWQDAVGGN